LGRDLGIEIVSANAIYLITIWAIPVIIAITFHEAAHGFVAYLLGDDTAWRLGRVSFNPLKHVDPFGTILLPGVLLLLRSPFIFGYAKLPITANISFVFFAPPPCNGSQMDPDQSHLNI
jgi:Zn-dependent protease